MEKKYKKIVIIYVLMYISIFCIPIFVTSKYIENEKNNSNNETEVEELKDNVIENQTTNQTIKVYMNNSNEIVEMNLEEYAKGVICAEMPADYEFEALKAQAVVARTYTLNKIRNVDKTGHNGADICTDSTHCQAYLTKTERIKIWQEKGKDAYQLWDKIEEAVISTSGEIITYNGETIQAFFHSNSGGMTENVELVWSGEKIDYLQAVETAGEANYEQYSSTAQFSKKEIEKIMKEKYSNFKFEKSEINIDVLDRSNSNRVQNILIGNMKISGVTARVLFGLKSTNFDVKTSDNIAIFNVIGYGHGVGMSQTGANELAKNEKKYTDIINHYYTNVKIEKIY